MTAYLYIELSSLNKNLLSQIYQLWCVYKFYYHYTLCCFQILCQREYVFYFLSTHFMTTWCVCHITNPITIIPYVVSKFVSLGMHFKFSTNYFMSTWCVSHVTNFITVIPQVRSNFVSLWSFEKFNVFMLTNYQNNHTTQKIWKFI